MKDLINRGDALAVVMYGTDKVEGIKNLPAADAVVEVVRCGKCVHRSRRPNCAGRHPDWFCADGERNEQ